MNELQLRKLLAFATAESKTMWDGYKHLKVDSLADNAQGWDDFTDALDKELKERIEYPTEGHPSTSDKHRV